MSADRRVCDFFGTLVEVRCTPCDALDIDFFFGPHVQPETSVAPDYLVELRGAQGFLRSLLAKDDAPKSFQVYADGERTLLLQERTFTRWSAMPSPLPPFYLMRDGIAVVQATVLVRDGCCVALCGRPHSGKTSVGLSLLERGWEIVSDQLLVVQRGTGLTCPYLAPVGLRGATLAALRARGFRGTVERGALSEVSGPVVLTRPEDLGPTVAVDRRLSGVRLVAVTRDADTASITSARVTPRVWPPGAWSWLVHVLAEEKPLSLLRLPRCGGEQRAADLIEEYVDD